MCSPRSKYPSCNAYKVVRLISMDLFALCQLLPVVTDGYNRLPLYKDKVWRQGILYAIQSLTPLLLDHILT
jgi:hypothetical protein